jgi:hypothetical protein
MKITTPRISIDTAIKLAQNKTLTTTRISNKKNIHPLIAINDSIKQITHACEKLKTALKRLGFSLGFSGLGVMGSLAFSVHQERCNANPITANSLVIKIFKTIFLIICGGSLLTSLGIAMSS